MKEVFWHAMGKNQAVYWRGLLISADGPILEEVPEDHIRASSPRGDVAVPSRGWGVPRLTVVTW